MPWNVLLIGSMLSGGTAESVPVQIFSDDEADKLFGKGSQAALMVRAFRKNNTLMPLWAVGVAERQPAKVRYTGPLLALSLYVGGQNLNIAVASGDTAADIAQANRLLRITCRSRLPHLPEQVTLPQRTDGWQFIDSRNMARSCPRFSFRNGLLTGGWRSAITTLSQHWQWFNHRYGLRPRPYRSKELARWSATNQKNRRCHFRRQYG